MKSIKKKKLKKDNNCLKFVKLAVNWTLLFWYINTDRMLVLMELTNNLIVPFPEFTELSYFSNLSRETLSMIL